MQHFGCIFIQKWRPIIKKCIKNKVADVLQFGRSMHRPGNLYWNESCISFEEIRVFPSAIQELVY